MGASGQFDGVNCLRDGYNGMWSVDVCGWAKAYDLRLSVVTAVYNCTTGYYKEHAGPGGGTTRYQVPIYMSH